MINIENKKRLSYFKSSFPFNENQIILFFSFLSVFKQLDFTMLDFHIDSDLIGKTLAKDLNYQKDIWNEASLKEFLDFLQKLGDKALLKTFSLLKEKGYIKVIPKDFFTMAMICYFFVPMINDYFLLNQKVDETGKKKFSFLIELYQSYEKEMLKELNKKK